MLELHCVIDVSKIGKGEFGQAGAGVEWMLKIEIEIRWQFSSSGHLWFATAFSAGQHYFRSLIITTTVMMATMDVYICLLYFANQLGK